LVESRRQSDVLGLSRVACFGLGGWNVADGFEPAPVVEAVHPFQGGELDGLHAAPWPAAPDDRGLVEAGDGFGQGIVVAVAAAADRRLNAGLGETIGVLYGNVLGPMVAVVNEAAALDRPAVVERRLPSVQDETGMGGASDACVAPASPRSDGQTCR
jgi:hypothetical protein